ncbi:MAG: Gfo/Idh/MocA family oxidoreductase [Gemmataceae bacterium]|nr:Gfo/Idh/MocA family oxidoreductase [Gemmataceae bacterium]
MNFGFAIVGCGMIARFHCKAIADIPGAKVVALIGRTKESAQKLAIEIGLTDVFCSHSLTEGLAAQGVDALIVTTPSGVHMDAAIEAAYAGKHVVVEKPLEITGARCNAIIDACEQAGVLLCTIFPSRFSEANLELKSAIDAGRFGRLTLGETTIKWWRNQQYYDEGGWKGTQALDGGGALMNQAIHNVDLLLWMMGPVALVASFKANLAHERIEVEDTAVAAIQFKNGALGVIQATTSVWPGLAKTISVHGSKGSVIIEQDDLTLWQFQEELPKDASIRGRFAYKTGASGGSSNPAAISHVGHTRQLADFIDAIRNGRKPFVDGAQGRRSVELIEAIYRSADTAAVVRLT